MELTEVGKRMQYLLGHRNRIRYIIKKNYLSEKYTINEIKVYPSETSRTIMSVCSHLQGLFPQSEKLGENLTESHSKKAYPPVNVYNTRIQEELELLQYKALYNCMTKVPFETITMNTGINIYEVNGCKGCLEKVQGKK